MHKFAYPSHCVTTLATDKDILARLLTSKKNNISPCHKCLTNFLTNPRNRDINFSISPGKVFF